MLLVNLANLAYIIVILSISTRGISRLKEIRGILRDLEFGMIFIELIKCIKNRGIYIQLL